MVGCSWSFGHLVDQGQSVGSIIWSFIRSGSVSQGLSFGHSIDQGQSVGSVIWSIRVSRSVSQWVGLGQSVDRSWSVSQLGSASRLQLVVWSFGRSGSVNRGQSFGHSVDQGQSVGWSRSVVWLKNLKYPPECHAVNIVLRYYVSLSCLFHVGPIL